MPLHTEMETKSSHAAGKGSTATPLGRSTVPTKGEQVRAPAGSLVIHGRAGQQEVGDVRDVHAQLLVAIGQGPDVQGIVDVLAAGRVDAAHGQVSQVLPKPPSPQPVSHSWALAPDL